MGDLAASTTSPPVRGLPLRLLGDERLARLTAAGSDHAFAVLYERHHQALYRYCRTIVRHDEDARDVLQTTMTRALAALARGVPDAPMRPWLFRIAHNEAISLLRRRQPAVELEQAPEVAARSLEAQVEERSRLATLVADLDELPDRQRSALVMRELSGLSHEEIAAALDIPVSAAKQAIFDARTGLQEFANGRAMDCADVQRIVSERDGRMLRGRPLRAHLRGCASCRALRDAIATRRADLAALAPPLPAAAATGLLSSLLGGGPGGGGLTSGIAAKVASGPLAVKALAGAAVATTVAVGTAQIAPPVDLHSARDGARPAAAVTTARAPGSASTFTGPVGVAGLDRAAVPATAARAARGASGTFVPAGHRRDAAPARAHAPSGAHAGANAATTSHESAPAASGPRSAAAARRSTPVHGRRGPAPPGAAHRGPSAPAAHARPHPRHRATPARAAHRHPAAPARHARPHPVRPARPSHATPPRASHPAAPARATGKPGATPAASPSPAPRPPADAAAARAIAPAASTPPAASTSPSAAGAAARPGPAGSPARRAAVPAVPNRGG